jgi:hypothetical protein
LDIVNPVFLDWRSIIAGALQREGASSSRAQRSAMRSVAAAEGAVAMYRASRNAQSLDDVCRELTAVSSQVVASANAPGE